MSWDVNEHVYDLEEIKKGKKTFKDVIDMKLAKKPELVRVKNDISGQVVYSEKGANVVVTAYDTQEVTYKMISTTISSEKETSGKNKGKYKVTTITYNATFDEDGKVNGYDDGVEKITYSKKAGTGVEEVVYQTVNSKNKVIATSDVDVEGQNKIIVNTGKVLGTVTCKNGEGSEYGLYLESADIDGDLFNEYWYAPQKSGKKYTGTWLQEEVDSTSANETFALGVNREDLASDEINYDMELAGGHGKDTVALVKDSRVNIALENDGGLIKTFTKSGNNVTMALGKSSDYDGNPDYKKEIMTVTKKSGDNYNVNTKIYVWNEDLNEGDGGYELVSDETDVWPHESIVLVAKQMKKDYGVDFHVGTNVYYLDEDLFMYQGGEESLAKVTFKNYLKLAQDGVTLNDESLKEILENAEGVGILGNKESTKKQKLTGTFLQEQFHGGTNSDTITTGDGDDFIYLSGGKDTVTVNGTGTKGFYFDGDPENLGQTTVKFAKGTSFELPQEGALSDGKTALNLAAVYNKDDFNFRLVKSGNDLVFDTGAYARALNTVYGTNYDVPTATLTVSDFFAENGALAGTVFDYDSEDHMEMSLDELNDKEAVTMYQFGNAKKANKMSDTKYDDMLIGGNKADKFTVSNSNARIVGLAGNDTINVEATAGGTVSIAETMGSGNDTLTIDPEVGENVEFMINGAYSTMMSSEKADISFEKTGNDLTFNMTYFKDAEAGIRKDINDSLTVKDFFNNEFDIAFGYNGEEPDDWYAVNAALDKKLIVNGVKDNDKESETYKKTVFAGTDYADSMTYAGKGAAFMAGGKFNDEYNVKLSKNTDVIIEDEDGKNVVNLDCSYKNLRVFFNADKNGIVTKSGDNETDDLLVFSKDSFVKNNIVKGYSASGKIDMDSFFTYDEEELEIGAHFKFTATDSDEMAMDSYVTTVASSVAGWLSEHTDYADAFAVLESGNTTDINSLIALYNVEYNPE